MYCTTMAPAAAAWLVWIAFRRCAGAQYAGIHVRICCRPHCITRVRSTPSQHVPSYSRAYLSMLAAAHPPPAGEALPLELLELIHGQAPKPVAVYNAYGPTECTVAATSFLCPPPGAPPAPGSTIPIGRPEPNVHCYILDPRSLAPVPVGVPGELVLSGPRLAAGYVGRPDLTDERFVPNPCYGAVEAALPAELRRYYERAYRTGARAKSSHAESPGRRLRWHSLRDSVWGQGKRMNRAGCLQSYSLRVLWPGASLLPGATGGLLAAVCWFRAHIFCSLRERRAAQAPQRPGASSCLCRRPGALAGGRGHRVLGPHRPAGKSQTMVAAVKCSCTVCCCAACYHQPRLQGLQRCCLPSWGGEWGERGGREALPPCSGAGQGQRCAHRAGRSGGSACLGAR